MWTNLYIYIYKHTHRYFYIQMHIFNLLKQRYIYIYFIGMHVCTLLLAFIYISNLHGPQPGCHIMTCGSVHVPYGCFGLCVGKVVGTLEEVIHDLCHALPHQRNGWTRLVAMIQPRGIDKTGVLGVLAQVRERGLLIKWLQPRVCRQNLLVETRTTLAVIQLHVLKVLGQDALL